MKAAQFFFFLIATLVSLVSCKKEDPLGNVDNIPGIGGDTWAEGPIDKWVYDSLTVPYNIAVKYKWDQFELNLDNTVVPPKEEKVIPIMRSIKKVWIDTYVAEAGETFFKKYGPKHFVLVGSGAYDDGTVLLGAAEGGRKVVLYQMNYFRVKGMSGFVLSDSALLMQMMQTIEHEFGHILHQNVMYPAEFKQINPSLYTTDWINTSDLEANNEGFVTAYSMSGPDDDFVEMISHMLTLGRSNFNQLVDDINYSGTTARGTTADVAKKRLRDKEALVVSYFKQVWNIDFYSLQTRTREALEALIY